MFYGCMVGGLRTEHPASFFENLVCMCRATITADSQKMLVKNRATKENQINRTDPLGRIRKAE